ncbi:XdhC family protein [Paenibacillus amylolyticus]|nr:XdhC family protein [Paenibacillus amylolyticus]
MLLTEDGKMYGSISPGCLESDLQARVSRVLDTMQMEFVEYDMRPEDDLSWGRRLAVADLLLCYLNLCVVNSDIRYRRCTSVFNPALQQR